jgi:hypothetical protein
MKLILGALLACAMVLTPVAAGAQAYNGQEAPAEQPRDVTPPLVLDEGVEQPAAAETDRAEVLGVEAQRTLPVTGGDLIALTGLALALVLVGAVLVRGRRSPAEHPVSVN